MKPHKFALAASIALLTLTVSQSAMALDGYQDRRGLFAGVGVGGGVGLVDVEGNESTGIDSGRKLGLHLNGMIGGGASDRLVIGGEGNWWARTAYIGDNALSHHHMSFNAVANFFILDGLFVEGGGGLARRLPGLARRHARAGRAAQRQGTARWGSTATLASSRLGARRAQWRTRCRSRPWASTSPWQ